MHFYRSIHCIKAITFDLDDTLYDNSLIVENAEAQMIKVLQKYDALQHLTLADFHAEKKAMLALDPEIYHDVIVWRIKTIISVLTKAKVSPVQIPAITDEAMACFTFWRHKMHVPNVTHQLLTQLATKYPLAVITNGNVEIDKIGLNDYFQFSLRGGADGRSKPFPEIFELAAQKLALPADQILHVGDNLSTDVNGAINSGFLACWINIFAKDIYHLADARCLPHIEITQLPELDNLL
ncbi:5-amino-6-(5-phospho-D-ribitylamino)uracil phosphatase YigB [Gilliamella sp. B3172]|uniref:5-amino-6-(5-phospho-D-ribitylamino)uracil phosphatase YigB n=1 Tax=Gilliamella sp. B3172 TaxID=2818006 RepID=UPI00226ABDEA|nr:5-amino-6-(5-phospho-D-ribitylamino)uracil phosphatase YigB [Gilliamella sp. B3172]MCX8638975.1 5-amino-6-(5-phospho-D-ribitylamino)uracil phosphatase YigB [Gilliamella sp. B3172]